MSGALEAEEHGHVCFSGAGSKKDVVFLIDGSQNAGPEFQHIRTLIERLVEYLDIGFDTTRVAVIQFSEDSKMEFPLNAHFSKDEVQNAVRRLRPKGGRQVYIGNALEYVLKNIFQRPLGSRIEEGVPQFLVLISSGKSADEVDDSAVELKQFGVAPLTIARHADQEELVKISLSPEYVYSVSTFRELPRLEQKLLTPITTLTSQQIQQILASTRYPSGKTRGGGAAREAGPHGGGGAAREAGPLGRQGCLLAFLCACLHVPECVLKF